MRCQRCGKAITPLRQLTDRAFCTEECKRKGPRASASMLRDLEHEDDPFWKNTHGRPVKQPAKTSNAAVAGLVVVAMVALIGVRILFPEPTEGARPVAPALPSVRPSVQSEGPGRLDQPDPVWLAWLRNHLPGDKPLRVRATFRNSAKGWAGDWTGAASGWSMESGTAHPGGLRLWKPTLNARNYTLEFRGSVEKRALSWAFRAQDARNYYATKIVILRAGEVSGANIVRYGVRDSSEFARAELPLPVALEANRPYRIEVQVVGSQFATLIDGTMVDRWTDNRLGEGGVGFFAEEGERAAIEWADFRERKGWFTSIFAAMFFLPAGPAF